MPTTLRATLTLLLLTLPLGSCCSISLGLSSLFCGASREPWNRIDFRTPEASMQTFLAGVGRDDPQVLYAGLSAGFRRRYGIEQLEFTVAWEKVKEQIPGLHLLGEQGDLKALPAAGDRVAAFELELSDYRFRFDLVAEDSWEVYRWIQEGDDPPQLIPQGEPLQDMASRIQLDMDRGEAVIRLADFPADIEVQDIAQISIARSWRVQNIRQLEE